MESSRFPTYRQHTIGLTAVKIYQGKPGSRHLFITNTSDENPIYIGDSSNVTTTNGHAILPGMVDFSTDEHVDLTQDIYAIGAVAGIVITIAEMSKKDPSQP